VFQIYSPKDIKSIIFLYKDNQSIGHSDSEKIGQTSILDPTDHGRSTNLLQTKTGTYQNGPGENLFGTNLERIAESDGGQRLLATPPGVS